MLPAGSGAGRSHHRSPTRAVDSRSRSDRVVSAARDRTAAAQRLCLPRGRTPAIDGTPRRRRAAQRGAAAERDAKTGNRRRTRSGLPLPRRVRAAGESDSRLQKKRQRGKRRPQETVERVGKTAFASLLTSEGGTSWPAISPIKAPSSTPSHSLLH